MADAAFPFPEPLTLPEERLRAAAARGELLAFDPAAPEAERLIRPAVIEALMRNHATRLTGRGLRVRWAVVAGPVDLAGLGAEEAPAPPLLIADAVGPRPQREDAEPTSLDLVLTGAVMAELDLQGSFLTRVEATDLVLRRRLVLVQCRTRASALLQFSGARIGSNVFLDGANVLGEVRFLAAEVGGQFNARAHTRFSHPHGAALSCDSIRVARGIFLDGADVAGEVRFLRAEVGDVFSARAGTRLAHSGGSALTCDGIRIAGSVFLDGAEVTGGASFLEAEIGGQLAVGAGMRIKCPNDVALSCENAIIRGGVFLRSGIVEGRAIFREAEVSHFDLSGSTLDALDAPGLRVGGDMRMQGATARAVHLDRSRVEGALILTDATLTPDPDDPEQIALSLEQARVETRIEVARLPSETRGVLDLRGLHTGLLDDRGGAGWGEPCRPDQPTRDAQGIIRGVRLRLDGFTYDRLSEFEDRAGQKPDTARAHRHAFLMRQFCGPHPGRDDFAPQPFDQVIKIARAAGHPRDADWFAREKRDFRRRCGVDGRLGTLWSWFTGLFFGHYYSPARAFCTLAATVIIGMAMLIAANQSPPVPVDDARGGATFLLVQRRAKVELPPEQAAAGLGGRHRPEQCWNSTPANFFTFRLVVTEFSWPRPRIAADVALTAFDLMLPVVELRQDDRCEVNDEAAGHEWWSAVFTLYSVLGLIILPMFLATVTGLLKREGT